ncbi:hypothetical protein GGI20_004508 [Coemansia sp. BCRC 34301]|nr:hypothetical protein GGI20_004508 [Coemansia sp. BCRC 34301]
MALSLDKSFFDAKLAQLSQLSTQRALTLDAKVPAGLRYPPKSYDFKMPAIQAMILPPEERSDYYSLTFKTLKAPVQKYTLHTSSVRTVAQVKRHLSRVSNIPVGNMRLALGGKGLVDGKLIGDYAIPEDAVIQIISKPMAAGEAAVSEVSADASNPLSSVLNQEMEVEAEKEQGTAEKVPPAAMTTDDDGSRVNEESKRRLRDGNGVFRTKVRELVFKHFSQSQASAVDSHLAMLLDKEFH